MRIDRLSNLDYICEKIFELRVRKNWLMETMLIELTNQKAAKLLKDLEDLKLIRVLKKESAAPVKLSGKYRGILSEKQGRALNKHIQEMRNEWDTIS